MKKDPRGSVWRQWDLHFHTPSSFDYDYKNAEDEQIIVSLRNAGISAVVISDHHNIDVSRIRNLQKLAGNNPVVFPGIELRSELGGKEAVHFIGIFPEDCDVGDLWQKLLGKLDITAADVERQSNERVYVPFEKGAKIIHDLKGLVSVHAGKKTNSIENISNADAFKQAVKEDLAKKHVDILEIGSIKDIPSYRDKVFSCLGFKLPMVIGSDNHDIRSYNRKEKCWIKADVTLRGLQHVLHESCDRIFLGDTPPSVETVNSNRTRYMRSVSFTKQEGSLPQEEWFCGNVPLHHGLVAIIGNKGSGKSALADILALLGDSPRGNSFSFLNSEKFRLPRANKAKHFEAELTWESGGSVKKNLAKDVDDGALESVKYIPQAYLEKICNELDTESKSPFSQELKSVIFSHIDRADRLDCNDLDSLIGYRTKETEAAIELLRTDLRSAIQGVVGIQRKLSESYKKNLRNQLEMKQRTLVSHDANKPEPVAKPEADPETQAKTAKVEASITELQQKLTEHGKQIGTLNKERATLAKKVAVAKNLLARTANFMTQHKTFRSASILDCVELGLDIDSLVNVKVNIEPVEEVKNDAARELNRVERALSEDNSDGEPAKKKTIEKIKSLRAELDKPQQEYQKHLNALKVWEAKRKEIVGDTDTADTLKYVEAQVESLKTLPEKLKKAKKSRMKSATEIYKKIHSLAEDYRKVYKSVQQFIQEHSLAKNRFEMQFEVAIVPSDFTDGFLKHISHGRKGSYCGQDEGVRRIKHSLDEADFNTAEGVKTFLEGIERSLSCDLRQDEQKEMSLESQLLRDVTPVQLYEYLYSLDYLKPRYILRWARKDIEQLSPGERGTLLLVFYLLIDRSDKPLIIDQPEENLDNQTVHDILVPAIKHAKTRRQIIVVTHNPNLAVVCDADQIIHAFLDKNRGNRVTYTSGAIENPIINQKLIDVLEGTWPAFHNREVKYHAAADEPPK